MESKLFVGMLIVAFIILAGANYFQWRTLQMTANMVTSMNEQLVDCKKQAQ